MRNYLIMGLIFGLMSMAAPVLGQRSDLRGAEVQGNQKKEKNEQKKGENEQKGGAEEKGETVASRFPNVYALSIGISEYVLYNPRLRFAHRDAEYFHSFIEKAYGDQPNKDAFKLLTNREATRENVNEWLNMVKDRAGMDDLVIIYFAGHGWLDPTYDDPGSLLLSKAENGKEGDAGADYLSLYDLINGQLIKLGAKKTKVLLILDACHAGSASNANIYGRVEQMQKTIFTILACQANEVAYESDKYGGGHGLFTWVLVRGLAGEANRNLDGVITYNELLTHLTKKMGEVLDQEQDVKDKVQTAVVKGSNNIIFPYTPEKFKEFWQPPVSAVQPDFNVLTDAQKQVYQKLRTALSQQKLIRPGEESVKDLFAKLYSSSTNKDLLAPVFREWMPVFSAEAQRIINEYYKADQIGTAAQYQTGADLLAECLKYRQYLRSEEVGQLRAQQSFLLVYATLRQYQDGQLTLTQPQRETRFRELLGVVSADTAQTDNAAPLHNVMGLLYNEIGDTARARRAYLRAGQLAPGWVMPINNLATLVFDPNQKIAGYQQALKNNPTFYTALLNIAAQYLAIKEYNKALEYLEKALQSAGKNQESQAYVYRQYALLYKAQGKNDALGYTKAIEYFTKSAQAGGSKFTTEQDIDWEISLLYGELGKYPEAATSLDSYLEARYPGFRTGKAKEVYSQFKDELAKVDDPASIQYAIGYCYEKGYGISKNLVEAHRWYTFAANTNLKAALGKLILLNEAPATIARYQKNYQKGAEKITIPYTKTDGTKLSLSYYIWDYPADTNQVYAEEKKRLFSLYEATLNNDITDAFQKLYRIATANNVSYQELCLYALNKKNETTAPNIAVFERKALEFCKTSQADSVAHYTRQAVVALNIDLKKTAESARILLDSLRQGTDHDGLLYYALGYLYETNPTGHGWSDAQKWYIYSFQVGYAPAYFRLLTRYRQLSMSSAAFWFTSNYNVSKQENLVTCRLADGKEKNLTLYVQEYPRNPKNPIEQEMERLKDVFGAVPTEAEQKTFAQIYTESRQKKQSFVESCRSLLVANTPVQTAKKQTASERYVEQGDVQYEKREYIASEKSYRQAFDVAIGVSERAWCLDRIGDAQYMQEQYDKALESYQTSVALDPRAGYYSNIGWAYRKLKNYGRAIESFRQAIEINSGEVAYHRILAETYGEAKEYGKADSTYQRALALDPNHAATQSNYGLMLIKIKRYDESIACFQKAIDLTPAEVGSEAGIKTGQYYFHLGYANSSAGKTTAAIAAYKKAIAFSPKESSYHKELGDVYYDSGQYELALTALQRALEIDPTYTSALTKLGLTLLALKRYDESLLTFERAAVASPDQAALYRYYYKGLVYKASGQLANAIESFRKAVENDPKDTDYLQQLASAYRADNQYDQAEEAYKRALVVDPRNGDLHSNYALNLLNLKRYAESIPYFLKAIELNPADAGLYHFHMGYAYQLAGKLASSIEAYQKAINLDPTKSIYNKELGDVYYEDKQYDLGIRAYRRSLELEPNQPSLYAKIGLSLLALKRYEESLAVFDQAAVSNPSQAALYQFYYKGQIYKQSGQLVKAIQLFQKALETAPKDTDYLRSLGSAYYDNKQYDLAAQSYRRILDIDPKETSALNSLGICLTYMKRYEDALSCFRKDIELNPEGAGVYYYNMACNYTLQGKTTLALQTLELSINKYKYGTYESIVNDPDFTSIHNLAEFKNLLNKYFPNK